MLWQVAWSSACIAGIPLHVFPATRSLDREAMATETKQKASALIESKGSTEFGIGSVTASICRSILFDQKVVRPVSIYVDELKVCLSKTVVLGRKGVEEIVELPLSDEESGALESSAKQLREVIEEAEKQSS